MIVDTSTIQLEEMNVNFKFTSLSIDISISDLAIPNFFDTTYPKCSTEMFIRLASKNIILNFEAYRQLDGENDLKFEVKNFCKMFEHDYDLLFCAIRCFPSHLCVSK